MKYAIIAAGEGSRLASEGITVSKPLVKIKGETLIERLVRIFSDNDAEEIVIATRQRLEIRTNSEAKIRQVICQTPSSMHSFYKICKYLGDAPFVLTTVDSIFNEKEFSDYISFFKDSLKKGADGVMGVTDFVDDEKPLFVKGDYKIDDFLDNDNNHECRYISGGIYGLKPYCILTLIRCMTNGKSRMRNFQRALIADGNRLLLYPFSKILDVDHATDIEKAEKFLNGRILCIYRDNKYSPNCVEKDCLVIDSLKFKLLEKGYDVSSIDEQELAKSMELPYADMYLSMARSTEVLKLLDGHNSINSSDGVRICGDRIRLASVMKELGIKIPEYIPDATEMDVREGVWVKKAVGTTEFSSDTTFCNKIEDYKNVINKFRIRGLDYVIERHEHGDLIKFYGVLNSKFFHIIYPKEIHKTKFGLESVNDKTQFFIFDKEKLEETALNLASHLGVRIFGGDAIVHSDGTYTIIDFNDWPSFVSVADEAVDAIINTIQL